MNTSLKHEEAFSHIKEKVAPQQAWGNDFYKLCPRLNQVIAGQLHPVYALTAQTRASEDTSAKHPSGKPKHLKAPHAQV